MALVQIKIADRQSLVDFALQVYGSAEGIWQLMTDNADRINDINDVLPAGTVMNVQSPVPLIDSTNQAIASYYAAKKVSVLSMAVKPTIPYSPGQIVDMSPMPNPPLPRVIFTPYIKPGYLMTGYIKASPPNILRNLSANIALPNGN